MNQSAFPLSEVLRWASQITGKGLQSERITLIDLVRETLEALQNEEAVENLRKWELYSTGSLITLPRELGDPQKYKICGDVGPVRNIAYKFLGYVRKDVTDFQSDMAYVGDYPTYFDLPCNGGRIAARSLDCFECPKEECKRPYLLVQGKDQHGQEVFSVNEGKTDVGERVYISDPNVAPTYSRTIFRELTAVKIVNAQLNIHLVWCNTAYEGARPHESGLLAIYDPGEEYPRFHRYNLPRLPAGSYRRVEVLGMLALPQLRYDNELIRGFDSNVIRSMLRANHLRGEKDYSGASFNSGVASTSLRRKNEKNSASTDMLAAFVPTSAAKFPRMF